MRKKIMATILGTAMLLTAVSFTGCGKSVKDSTSAKTEKTTKETKKSTSPKTGDNTPILFWILLAGAGMAGLGGTVILRKKKK